MMSHICSVLFFCTVRLLQAKSESSVLDNRSRNKGVVVVSILFLTHRSCAVAGKSQCHEDAANACILIQHTNK